jgi:hypothetical protein
LQEKSRHQLSKSRQLEQVDHPSRFKLGICNEPSCQWWQSCQGVTQHVHVIEHHSYFLCMESSGPQVRPSVLAFVHWYINEGMEEGEFSEVCEDLALFKKITRKLALTLLMLKKLNTRSLHFGLFFCYFKLHGSFSHKQFDLTVIKQKHLHLAWSLSLVFARLVGMFGSTLMYEIFTRTQ